MREEDTTVESVLQASWNLPMWLVIVLVLASAGVAAWLYSSERGRAGKPIRWLLAAIRFVLFMIVLWMLCGWSWLRFRSDPPELIVVIDRSASMSTRDVGDTDSADAKSTTRFEKSIELFQEMGRRDKQRLVEQYQMHWYVLAESLEPLSYELAEDAPLPELAADGLQTRLGDGLLRLIERQTGKGTAAIVLLSDGINTSGAALSEAAKAARRAAIPLHVLALGRQYELPDLRLADLLVDREVYLGDQVTAEVSVIVSDATTADTRLVLRDASSEKVLDETRVTLNGSQRQVTARLSFVPDRAGDISLRLEAEAIQGETELVNNSLEAVVRVQDKTVRVLLVSQVPSYEFRFLKSFLQRATQVGETPSATFELHTVLQDADRAYVDQDDSALRLVPSSREALIEYDAFVFCEFDPQLVSQNSQQAIVEAVTDFGSGCIFVFGLGNSTRRLEGWPLAKLLPTEPVPALAGSKSLQLGQLSWQPTSLGISALPMQLAPSPQESLRVWNRLPEFASVCQIEQLKTGAQLLAEAVDPSSGQTAPLLITQFAGAGRTALQASDETYRWTSFMGSDLYYQRYWGQMLRWLSRGRLRGSSERIELLVDPKQARFGGNIRFQVTLGAEGIKQSQEVEIVIDGSSGPARSLSLPPVKQADGVYQAELGDLRPGSYRAKLLRPLIESPPSEEFSVTAPPGEQASLRANVEGLQDLANQSRGRFYQLSDASRLLAELPPGKPTRLGALPSIPLWNAWWVALLFVTLITTEWILRRTYHML